MSGVTPSDSPRFTVTRRYYPHTHDYDCDLTEDTLEKVERRVSFAPELCALILLDVWNTNCMGAKAIDKVIVEHVAAVVAACREAGIQVIHAPGPAVADKYPLRRFKPTPRNEHLFAHEKEDMSWPTREMMQRNGPYREYCMWREDPDTFTASCSYDRYFIHPAVEPVGEEMVIGDRRELHLLLKNRGRFNLFYTGFVANGCMLERDYGVRWIGYLGYDITLLRDCTRAMEMSHTVATLSATQAAIDNLEFWIATTLSGDLVSGLREAGLVPA